MASARATHGLGRSATSRPSAAHEPSRPPRPSDHHRDRPTDGTLAAGGDEVTALQAAARASSATGTAQPDGRYGQLTRQAVMAFQKAQGLGRDGVAGPATLAALDARRPARRRATRRGTHLEIDLGPPDPASSSRAARPSWVLNTSTGNGEAYASPRGGTAVATTPDRAASPINREIDGLRRGTPRHALPAEVLRRRHRHPRLRLHPGRAGLARLRPASPTRAMDLLWSSGSPPSAPRC